MFQPKCFPCLLGCQGGLALFQSLRRHFDVFKTLEALFDELTGNIAGCLASSLCKIG